MKIIKHAARSCTVNLEGNELLCKSALVSTECEAYVHLKVNLNNIIEKMQWELYRAPFDYVVKSGEIRELAGESVFTYSSHLAENYLDPLSKQIILELISEGVRGVMQTSRFPGKKAQIPPSLEELNKRPLADFLTGTCAFHSLPNRFELSQPFREKNYTYPGISLFHRQKSYSLYAQMDRNLYAAASFADTDHEIVANFTIAPDRIIKDVNGTFLRFPLPICETTKELLKNLQGKNMGEMSKKEIAKFVGGPHGCTHLVELCYDLALELAYLTMTT